jgi:hypothetical protein
MTKQIRGSMYKFPIYGHFRDMCKVRTENGHILGMRALNVTQVLSIGSELPKHGHSRNLPSLKIWYNFDKVLNLFVKEKRHPNA